MSAGRRAGPRGRRSVATVVCGLAGAMILVACGKSTLVVATTTTIATTTTTTLPALSALNVVGVRPGVLQAPFYPQITVSRVTCGAAPKGGRFVRIDLPAGGPGTPVGSVLTRPTAVMVIPGGAVLIDPRYLSRALYTEVMKSVMTSTQGAFVLTLQNSFGTGGDGLTVVVGNVQVNGDYECPAADVPYPGT